MKNIQILKFDKNITRIIKNIKEEKNIFVHYHLSALTNASFTKAFLLLNFFYTYVIFKIRKRNFITFYETVFNVLPKVRRKKEIRTTLLLKISN